MRAGPYILIYGRKSIAPLEVTDEPQNLVVSSCSPFVNLGSFPNSAPGRIERRHSRQL